MDNSPDSQDNSAPAAPRAQRQGGKKKGFAYFKTRAEVRLELRTLYNLGKVGDPQQGGKMPAETGRWLTQVLVAWLQADKFDEDLQLRREEIAIRRDELERKKLEDNLAQQVEQLLRQNEAYARILAERGIIDGGAPMQS